jgi:hypothetical protein
MLVLTRISATPAAELPRLFRRRGRRYRGFLDGKPVRVLTAT